MQDFLYFLGRFHVLALHLPIGIILVAVALDWSARSQRYRSLAAVSPFLWGGAAMSAVLAAALGYLHFAESAFTGPSANAHRIFGTTVAIAAVLIFSLSRRPALYRRVNVVTGVLAAALVAITGHFGGELTHGSTYLFGSAAGLGRDGSVATEAASRPQDTSADAVLVERLNSAGLLVRRVSQSDPRMIVTVASPGGRVGPDAVAALLTAADAIVELNLQDSEIDDAAAAELGKLVEVARLRLSRNAIGDGGVAALARLPRLTHLNVYGNAGITDASVDVLAGMKSLRVVDVWETGITTDGIARLRDLRPDLAVQGAASSALSDAAPAAAQGAPGVPANGN
jgi:uncharacterized membrane protein